MGLNEREALASVTHEIVAELVKAQKEGRDVNLNRLKCQISQKHGVKSQPKLVDIIAAVPHDFKVKFYVHSKNVSKHFLELLLIAIYFRISLSQS